MTWHEQLRGEGGRLKQRQCGQAGVASVRSVGDIPIDATPQAAYRLTVEVVRLTEQVTRNGSPCWFVNCRDAEGLTFDVVVWETQMARFQGRIVEGATMPLAVRVPTGTYSAFTLV
jgi:DNA polymerase III alpha subunit